MRKLIMSNVSTLDGYFEGKAKWDLSFHNTVWGPELERLSLDQLHTADYLIFGRVTYEGMAAYWKNAEAQNENLEIARLMNSLPKIVFSKTLKGVDWNNTTLVSDNAAAEISRLKAEGGRNMYVFGSADLCTTFINDDLFDEYRIIVAPTILGGGTPLFKERATPKGLTLMSAEPFSTGGVMLKYVRKAN